MTSTTEPTILLSHLHRADGSATFSQNGFTVIGAINGPFEVSRRDENPEEAVVDVTIRPAIGTGGMRERHLESLIQSTLRQTILIHDFPRTLIQVILQITNTPDDIHVCSKTNLGISYLPLLPALLQVANLALLSASIPLNLTLTSTLLALISNSSSSSIIENPSISHLQSADSLHVLAFTSHGDLLLSESEGFFTLDEWNNIYDIGRKICCNIDRAEGSGKIMNYIKSSLQTYILVDQSWKK